METPSSATTPFSAQAMPPLAAAGMGPEGALPLSKAALKRTRSPFGTARLIV